LALESWGIAKPEGSGELERVELMDVALSNLKPFKAWKKLHILALPDGV